MFSMGLESMMTSWCMYTSLEGILSDPGSCLRHIHYSLLFREHEVEPDWQRRPPRPLAFPLPHRMIQKFYVIDLCSRDTPAFGNFAENFQPV